MYYQKIIHISKRIYPFRINAESRTLNLPELVAKFLEDVVKYSNTNDSYPLTWPTPTGRNGNLFNFRVKMTNAFWNYFMGDGKRKLQEYNRRNGASVRVLRDHTINISDVKNLSL